ncbi:MAG: hypothetical protein CME62_08625 [Halobacteriovoraceae bacterium]|nr:hypothetical protein [Halobacteriovoraceae bacterium]|tara:strand:- start:16098 stop:17174 length:1077 start_codon:yes stop_codon:yes gene_type:complete
MEQIDLKKIRSLIKESSNTLVFTNRNSFYTNEFDKLLVDSPDPDKNKITFYNDFEINPKIEDISKALCHLDQDNHDLIVGIGGGTPLDFAKAFCYFKEFDKKEVNDLMELVKKPVEITKKTSLALIPTTCGSGSEATEFSVIYYQKKKFSLSVSSLLPDYYLLDGVFIESLPRKILAFTALDSITHATESFWSKNATQKSKEIAIKSLRLSHENLEKAFIHNDKQALNNLLEASNLAGQAINITKTTAVHALSYYLTTYYSIPHGQAVGNLLPYLIEINSNNKDYNEMFSAFDCNTASEYKTKIILLLKNLNIYLDLEKIIDNVEELVDSVNIERLANNPIDLNREQLLSLFTHHHKG